MPVSKDKFKKGKPYEIMRLEELMEPDMAYTLKEICKLADRTSMRVGFKLRQLQGEKKAERRRIDGKIHWMLTTRAYTEGTVKSDKNKLRLRGRPEAWRRMKQRRKRTN